MLLLLEEDLAADFEHAELVRAETELLRATEQAKAELDKRLVLSARIPG